mgnify:CR=1 FL=1|tara:strand:+ start:270 stop:533 length:264 start_codon:yes stop_codon:yes gene_type:complete
MQPKHPLLVQVGKTIRERRKAAGFSQDGFANHIGLDRSYYGHIERGNYNITLLVLEKIAAGLDVDAGALLPSRSENAEFVAEAQVKA